MEAVLLAATLGGTVMISLIAAAIMETHKAELALRDREHALLERESRARRG